MIFFMVGIVAVFARANRHLKFRDANRGTALAPPECASLLGGVSLPFPA
jgi:hypothetical protein